MLADVFSCVLDDLGHLDEHAFVFGNGVKRNNCFPLSTMHDPVRHETRGEGETIRSVSGKLLLLQTTLCEGDIAGPAWGKMLLLLGNNCSFPFAADFGKTSMGCFGAFSVLAGEASSACLSLEDHCCVRRRTRTVMRRAKTQRAYAHVYFLQKNGKV
jgi:hypothetical protein